MPIATACPTCFARLRAPAKLAGKKVNCPRCGHPLAVPAAEPDLEALAAADLRQQATVPEPPPPAAPATTWLE